MEIKGLVKTKDVFGGDYYYINPTVLTKRKAWNYLLSIGFERCPNKAYLKKDNIYAHNNSFKSYLIIEGI